MIHLFSRICRELEQHHSLILVTILCGSGSAPRGTGSQMLVGSEGRLLGTIGGGAVEYEATKLAQELWKAKRSTRQTFRLFQNDIEDIGMTCGGDVTLWLQYICAEDTRWAAVAEKVVSRIQSRQPGWLVQRLDGGSPTLLAPDGTILAGAPVSPEGLLEKKGILQGDCFSLPLPIGERAVIFGGGHCAQALVPLLQTVGFRVTVVDQRQEFATKALFPQAESVICSGYGNISDYLSLTEEDFVVVMTNGHSHDFEVQEQVLRQPVAYIGVIGSRKKTAFVNEKLRQAGVSDAAIASVHTPIGTAIKAVTPEEIAVSIAGEMIHERALRREAAGFHPRGCPMHE